MLNQTRKFLASAMLAVAGSATAAPGWQQIDLAGAGLVNAAGELVDPFGQPLHDRQGATLVPNCALGPSVGGPFRFFVQPGDPRNVLVYHTGGGACWEGNTCGSIVTSPRPTYSPIIQVTAPLLDAAGGILAGDDPANPFASWTKVYIPYCTGDVGWGNRDTLYLTGAGPLPIHHRGYANVRAVAEWLKGQFQGQGAPRNLLVAGASAGGYAAVGTLLPEVVKLVPTKTSVYLIGDSANGVVTDDFLSTARISWGYDATLPDYLLSAVSQGADGLPVRTYVSSIQANRSVRHAQIQNAFDVIQTSILNTMKHVNDPSLWTDPTALGESLLEWTTKMRSNVLATALSPSYRFYTAAGTEHVMLEKIGPEVGAGFCSDDFATESSARSANGPLALRDFASDMVFARGFLWNTGDWANATCFPNCIVPPQPGCGP